MNDSANNQFGRRAPFMVASAVLDAAHATYMNAFGRVAAALTDHSRSLDQDDVERARTIMHRIEQDLLTLGNMMRIWSRP